MRPFHLVLSMLSLAAVAAPGFGQIVSTPASVTISGQIGGPVVTTTISLTSTTASSFLIVPNPQAAWLQVSPSNGTTPATVTLTATPAILQAGTYSTTLQIFSGTPTPLNVPVTFTVSSIGANPTSLSFTYQAGGSLPPAQTLSITSFSTTAFTASASTSTGGNWLQVAPANGNTPNTLTVTLNPAVVPSLAAGTYTGSISIAASFPLGASAQVQVTLTVAGAAQVTVSPNALSFAIQTGGTNNVVQQNITLSTNSSQILNYGFTVQVDPNPAGANWLSVTPTGGAIAANGSVTASVTVVPGSLPQGVYRGRLLLFVPGASPANQEIVVTLTVSSLPLLNVPSAGLTFTSQIGTPNPPPQTVTPTSTSTALSYTIVATTATGGNWLSVPASGTTPNGFQVSVNPGGLVSGTYTGTITVTGIGSGNGPQQIAVTLKVSNDPVILASATALTFAYQTGQNLPALQAIRITSSTGAPLSYSVSALPSWIVLGGPTIGTTEGTITVQANVTGQTAGTYDGAITIAAVNPATGAATVNSPVTIPVKLYVSASPLLVANPASVAFTAQVGGAGPAAQTITLSSTSATEQMTLNIQPTTDSGGNWLAFAGLQSGSTPNTFTLSVVPQLLSAGTYTGKVTVTATGPGGATVANSPFVIPVTLTMTQGNLSVTPATLTFAPQVVGAPAPAKQSLSITTTSGPAVNFTIAASSGSIGVTWLSASVNAGTTPATVDISIDPSRLTPGTYQGQITVTAPGVADSPAFIPVTFTVTAGTIAVSPASLTFSAFQNGSAPAAQTLNVTVSAGGALNYNVAAATTSGGNWLSASPTTGTTPGSVSITVNPAGLAPGTYNGSITITSPGAAGSPLTVPVTFTVASPQTLTVTPATMSFSYTSGLTVPAAQTFQVTASGGAAAVNVAAQTASGGSWLSISPPSGNTPITITVSVSPANLSAGSYNGTVTVTSPNSANPATVAVSLTVIAIPPPNATAVVNSASFASGPVSPGEIVTIGGTGMANAGDSLGLQLDGAGSVSTKLGDTRVLFDGIPGPLVYVSATQVNTIVPYTIAGRVTTRIQVEYKGVLGPATELRVVDAVPAVFTQNQSGTGPGAILNQNYSLNTTANPAAKLSVVAVYATGEGQTSPAGVTGSVIPSNGSGLKRPLLNVTATVGGRPARVLYAGSAPGAVSGAFQVNVEIPEDAASGAQPIVITVGSNNTQPGVTVAVQ